MPGKDIDYHNMNNTFDYYVSLKYQWFFKGWRGEDKWINGPFRVLGITFSGSLGGERVTMVPDKGLNANPSFTY